MGKLGKKWHKKSLYSKAMTLFIILLLMLTILFLLYVTSTMVMYEESLIDNHIKKLVTSGSLADNIEIEDYEKNKYETTNISSKNGLKKLFKTSDIKIAKNKKEKGNVYDLYLNDANVATISFEKVGSQTKMLILTIDEWKIKEITTNFDRGIYYYDIIIPTNYKLYINNKEVTDSYKESNIEELERVTEYVEVAKTNVYTLDNFIEKPDIVIKDENGKKVKYDLNNNKIDIGFFESIENIEDFREVEFEKIKKEKYVLVVPKNYHLASKHEVSLKDLKDEFFIMVDEYKNKIVKYHEKIGYIPKILVQPKEAGVMGVLVLVAAGAGVTILPNTQMINVDKISILNIKEDIGYKTIYMGWNKHKSEVAIVKNFKEFVIKKYK